MADPKGFLKTTDRELPVRRPVALRLMDWKEVYEQGDSAVLKRQAGRAWTAAYRSATRAAHSAT